MLEPGLLATLLDEWALKREKVLRLLDLKAAQRARRLVARCRRLEADGFSPLLHCDSDDANAAEWLAIRRNVVDLLRPAVEQATGT